MICFAILQAQASVIRPVKVCVADAVPIGYYVALSDMGAGAGAEDVHVSVYDQDFHGREHCALKVIA